MGAVCTLHHPVVLRLQGSLLFALRIIPCGKMALVWEEETV